NAILWQRSGQRDVDAHLAGGVTPRELTSTVSIDSLRLYSLSRDLADPRVAPIARSAVREGTLAFPSVDSTLATLGPTEWLELGGLEGELLPVRYTPNGLVVTFRGLARTAIAHGSASRRVLMPTWFESVRARRTPAVIWSAIAWMAATVWAVVRWWRRPTSC